ncbi:MAG: MFS transporter [Chloroflexota bacterium]|nr:MFS transporter [Chloroflexota bacterium]
MDLTLTSKSQQGLALGEPTAAGAADGAAGPGERSSGRARLHTFQALGVRDFRWLWFGFAGTWLAMQMLQVARGYLAYELTGNAFSLGLVTLAMGLPRIILSPLGGVIADRFPKRVVLMSMQAALGFLAIGAAVMVALNLMTIQWLIVFGLLQGSAFGLVMPARQAYVPQVVGKGNMLANAIALNSAGMNLCRIVGPTIAGVLIAIPRVSVSGAFFAVAVGYLLAWLSTYRVQNRGVTGGARQSVGSSLREGFAYVGGNRQLLALMSLGFVPLALGMPYISLMPAVALGDLGLGATGLGWMLTLTGAGALCGTLVIASLASSSRKAALQLICGLAFGVSLTLFSVGIRAHLLGLALPFLFLTGAAGDAYMALNSTLLLLSTEEGVYGRVMGVYMVAQSIRPITVLPISALADAISTPLTLGIAGAVVTVFVAGVASLYPAYRTIGQHPVLNAPRSSPAGSGPS